MRLGWVRTLWGTTPILTIAFLARCDRTLGFRSDSLVFTNYYTWSRFDINLRRISDWVLHRSPRRHENLLRWIFAWALLRYDVFHYFYDRGILPSKSPLGINQDELEALTKAEKRLYTYAYGADVRTRQRTLALGEFNLCKACPDPGRHCICDDRLGDANIESIRAHATAMVTMGDMVSYVPGSRVMQYWPIDLDRLVATPLVWKPGQTLRVAHAPNHPFFKGTNYLQDAVKRLQTEGVAVELLMVQGVPNETVIQMFTSAHVVADQFIIANFHGYTALEAMALGRPVLSYLPSLKSMVCPEESPLINATPKTLYEVLLSIANGEIDIVEIGRRSRVYVERHYSVAANARRLAGMYVETGNFPVSTSRRLERYAAAQAR